MVISKIRDMLKDIILKYKYAILLLLVGIILMTLPLGTNEQNVENLQNNSTNEIPLENKLSELLSKVDGAGRVEVILTVVSGEEVIYQEDESGSLSDNSNSNNNKTVTVTDSDRNQTGLIKQINPEVYKGAIILCQGANDPVVRLSIVEAVSRCTGLGANCISVLKMK